MYYGASLRRPSGRRRSARASTSDMFTFIDPHHHGDVSYRFFFFSSRRRHTRSLRDWSSDVCSSDLVARLHAERERGEPARAARVERHRAALARAGAAGSAFLGRDDLVAQAAAGRRGDLRRDDERGALDGGVEGQPVARLAGRGGRAEQEHNAGQALQCCVIARWLPAPPLCVAIAELPLPDCVMVALLWLAPVPAPPWLIVATFKLPDCVISASLKRLPPVVLFCCLTLALLLLPLWSTVAVLLLELKSCRIE